MSEYFTEMTRRIAAAASVDELLDVMGDLKTHSEAVGEMPIPAEVWALMDSVIGKIRQFEGEGKIRPRTMN